MVDGSSARCGRDTGGSRGGRETGSIGNRDGETLVVHHRTGRCPRRTGVREPPEGRRREPNRARHRDNGRPASGAPMPVAAVLLHPDPEAVASLAFEPDLTLDDLLAEGDDWTAE